MPKSPLYVNVIYGHFRTYGNKTIVFEFNLHCFVCFIKIWILILYTWICRLEFAFFLFLHARMMCSVYNNKVDGMAT